MRVTLSGWQRLWVVGSILYLIPVFVIATSTFPRPAGISHETIFYDQLSPDSKSKLILDENKNVSDDLVGVRVEMPNGHVLQYRNGLKEEEMQPVAREYYGLLERKASKDR